MDCYEWVRFILERDECETLPAAQGSDGVTAAVKQGPDLILMDLSMLKMDGWDSTIRIKSNPKTMHLPSFAIIAHALPGDHRHTLDMDCDGLMTKLFDLPEPVEVVDRTIPH
jgi:CheY-like chemotaxis protein